MMKTPLLIATLVAAPLIVLTGCSGAYDRELLGDPEPVAVAPAQTVVTQDDVVDAEPLYDTPDGYAMFDDLDPYGAWYESAQFGVVWRPGVGVGWQPYYQGHWIWTTYGWMWVSYDPFGWATYHYGNWWMDPMLGWVWVPGYQWSACPVDWYDGGGWIGWAPVPPPGCAWDDPWNDGGRYRDGWVVVETGKFKQVDVGDNRLSPQKIKSVYRSGAAVREAPKMRSIELATRQSVKQTDVRIDTRRVGNHELRTVVLPEREQQIVDRFPVQTVTPANLTRPVNSGGTVTPPPVDTGKTKGSTPPPAVKDTKPAKVKGSSGAARNTGKAKGGSKDDKKDDGGKAKGGNDKDDSKDNGGKSKSGSSSAKAKGKKG
jgi:hypothetical protein